MTGIWIGCIVSFAAGLVTGTAAGIAYSRRAR